MMRGRRIDEIAAVDAFSLCGSRISISLSTIQEEASAFDYFSSQSSFGTVSSFDSAMISAESLCSGCRFDSVAKGAKNSKTSKLMPSLPSHPKQQLIRPKEIIFEGLDEMEQNPAINNLTENARRPLRSSLGSSSGDSGSSCSYQSRGAEYTKPLNDDCEHDSYLRRSASEAPLMDDFLDTPEYSRPLNDEYDTHSGREYSRPLNDDPHHHYGYSSHRRYSTNNEEEKVEEDRPLASSTNRLPDSSEWIRQFEDMRLIASPMPSPGSSCSSKSRTLTITVESILSNPDSLRPLED